MEGYTYAIPSDKLFLENDDGECEMLIIFYKENYKIFRFGNHFINFFTIIYYYEGQEVGFFGGDRNAMAKEWYYCLNEMTPRKKARRNVNLCWSWILFISCYYFRNFIKF